MFFNIFLFGGLWCFDSKKSNKSNLIENCYKKIQPKSIDSKLNHTKKFKKLHKWPCKIHCIIKYIQIFHNFFEWFLTTWFLVNLLAVYIHYHENNGIYVYCTKQPVKILLIKLERNFYFHRFVKILLPWYTLIEICNRYVNFIYFVIKVVIKKKTEKHGSSHIIIKIFLRLTIIF